jgi:hypothetical protein
MRNGDKIEAGKDPPRASSADAASSACLVAKRPTLNDFASQIDFKNIVQKLEAMPLEDQEFTPKNGRREWAGDTQILTCR